MPTAMLSDQEIMLRAIEPGHVNLFYQIENDTTLWQYSAATQPFSHHTLRQYIADSQNDVYADKQLRLVITLRSNHTAVGVIDLFDFDVHQSRAAVGVVVLPPHRKHHYATAALKLLTHYAHNHLHIHQLYAHIAADNRASIALFSAAGYSTQCTLSQWLRTPNGYIDAILAQHFER